MKILVTGFDPFGGESINPAYEAVKLLPDCIGGAAIVKQLIPTSFLRSGRVLEEAIECVRPEAVVCIGQAGGRAAITPERLAVNLMDSPSPDNDGFIPTDIPVCADGENAYFSTLPVKEMAAAIKEAGVNAALSLSAGHLYATALCTGFCIFPLQDIRECAAVLSMSRILPDRPSESSPELREWKCAIL